MLPCQNRSAPSPDSKALSRSVFFWGWRYSNKKFESWAKKMSHLHEPTWKKAGIFEAVMASTFRISKNADLVVGIAEKWCPDTKTFVFPWGETAITLEDVMLLSGFSVLGSPVFTALDSSGQEIKAQLDIEWKKIRKDKVNFVTQVSWMERFMNSGDELEHVAFLMLWLNYFVFPSRLYQIYKAVLPIAIHLSRGTRIALAPAVLAHLYAELTLLKNHITSFSESTSEARVDLTALFKLVQVWTWERFRKLQPKPNPLLEGEPRLALWHNLLQRTSNARQILDSSKIDSFEWRPYTKTVENWRYPLFYPEKEMCILVSPCLDDDFISFARFIKASELVGIYNVEHYFPNRVASQFGLLQDVPSLVNRSNLSLEAAWNDYNQPIDDLTILHIPSRLAIPRVTPTFCEWWRKSFPELQNSSMEKDVDESAEILKPRNIEGDDDDTSFVPSGSTTNRKSEDYMKIAEDFTNKRRKFMKQARDKRRKFMKQAREYGYKKNKTRKDEMKIARDKRLKYMKQARDIRLKYMKQARKNGSKVNRTSKDGIRISEDLNKRRKHMKRVCENDESTMAHFHTQVHSADDEEDNRLSTAQFLRLEKKRKKYSTDVKNSGGDTSKQLGKRSRLEVDTNDSVPYQKLASISDGGNETVQQPEIKRNKETDETGRKARKSSVVENPFDENNPSEPPFGASGGVVDVVVSSPETRQACDDELDVYERNAGKKTMVDDGLRHDNALGNEDTMKCNEQVEDLDKGNSGFGDANNESYKKRVQELKVMASSIKEHIIKAQRNVAWLKERSAIKQKNLAESRWI